MNAQPPPTAIVRSIDEVVRQELASLVGELRAGGEAAWTAPTACAGWQAKDVVAHLLFGARLFDGLTHAYLENRPPAPFNPAERDAAMQALATRPREELLGELEHLTLAYADYLEAQDAATLQRVVALPFGQLPVWQLAGVRLNELAIHHWDIRAPHDPAARIAPAAVPILLGAALGALPILARGEKRDGVWQLDVDAPMGGSQTLRIRGDQVSVAPGSAPDADATLRLDGDAFLRLVWGRLDLAGAIDAGRVQVQGDRERALALQRLFPGV